MIRTRTRRASLAAAVAVAAVAAVTAGTAWQSGAAGAPAPVDATAHASGLPWSDGGFFEHNAQEVTDFAAWRGRPVDNVVAFTTRDSFAQQLNSWWGGTVPPSFDAGRDDFILSVPLWTNDRDAGTDEQWRQLGTEIAGVDPDGYVRLGWEMNCCYSLATDVDAWRSQFTRAATQLKAAAPGLKIVFNPNEGASGGGTVEDPSVLFVDGLVDVVALDAYDWYPAYDSDENWANHRDKQFGWNWWYDFARSKGVPFALGEFSVYSGSSASGGDDPAYFSSVYGWLAEKAAADPGSIAFVSLFNEAADYCGCQLYPSTVNAQAAAKYRALLDGIANGAGGGGDNSDIAQGKPTTASSTENDDYPPSAATDGDPATRWSSAFDDPQWLQVDLGRSYSISHVRLAWETAYASGYDIQLSDDGETWTTVYSTASGDGGTDDLDLSGSGRYLRLSGATRATEWGYSLWDVSVTGS